ncbi:hypothetical protein F5Y18DRAFT_428090 [Xylariaceae sp. FL1019]|nr:hypothetical protein F5Y18DRAFT_428090 [Xylariaceae sp. FL1019]
MAAQQDDVREAYEDAEIAITIRERDPLNAEGSDLHVQTLSIDRKILIDTSPTFKAMLAGKFAEAHRSHIEITEDTGATCKAMQVLFGALHAKHLSLSSSKVNDDLIMITPLHLLELKEFTFLTWSKDYHCNRGGCVGVYLFDEQEIGLEDLSWWLSNFSARASEGTRTMTPYPTISLTSDQLASSLWQMKDLLGVKGIMNDRRPRRGVDMRGIALLHENLLLQSAENKSAANLHVVTRIDLVHFARGLFTGEIEPHPRDSVELLERFQDERYCQRLPGSKDYSAEKHPNPSTYYLFTLDQIRQLIRQPANHCDHIRFDEWHVTRDLWQSWIRYDGQMGARQCRLRDNTFDILEAEHGTLNEPTTVTATLNKFNEYIGAPGGTPTSGLLSITPNDIMALLVAIDKYLISPSTLKWCFDLWVEVYCNEASKPQKTEGGNAKQKKYSVEELLLITHAAYKFDHHNGFLQATRLIRRYSDPHRRSFDAFPKHHVLELILKYPGLDDVLLEDCIEATIGTCEGLEQDGICLDCFNASRYFSMIDSSTPIPKHLQKWANDHMLEFARRMSRDSKLQSSRHVSTAYGHQHAWILAPMTFGCRGETDMHHCYESWRWERSWVNGYPLPGVLEHQERIYREARNLGWHNLVEDPHLL